MVHPTSREKALERKIDGKIDWAKDQSVKQGE
jgi:hypothetical protein